MSDQLAPRPYSDRELTLRAISLTFQRARAAQLDLTGEIDVDPDGMSDLDSDGPTDDDAGPPGALDEAEEGDLPNPIVTDANLRHYLEQATSSRTDADTERGRSRIETLRAIAVDRGTQARYNDAVLNAIHQLDHRTRLQQRTITRLEAELAEARRALAALEEDEGHSP